MQSKKELEVALSKLEQVTNPNPNLEQYQTPSDIAAKILWFASLHNDTQEKIIADLGCGNGIFGIGASLLGAKKIFFVDTEGNSINATKKNISLAKIRNSIILHQPVTSFIQKVDTVFQNPPFGVQKPHADREFLIQAMNVAKKIYSIHKKESEGFVRALTREHNFAIEGTIPFKFQLKRTQPFHTKETYTVEVNCFILARL